MPYRPRYHQGLDIRLSLEELELLLRLRRKQREFFQTRSRQALLECRGLEKQVDRLLARFPDPNEPHLFNVSQEVGK